MTNRSTREGSAGDGVPDLLDVTSDGERVSTRVLLVEEAGGRDAVKVLAADRDTGDEAGEIGAILLNG